MLNKFFLLIKTHGSVSCGPRSRHTTPASILTGRTIMQFSRMHNFVLLVQNWTVFAVQMPASVSTSHSKFQLNRARRFRDISFQNWLSFFVFFFPCFFCLRIKVTIKWKQVIWLPWNLVHRKGTSWYQVWLEYNKHLLSYLRSLTKNNTNMMSRPQGKPCVARSWKLVQR